MSCLMFINGSHVCSNSVANNELFCNEHTCKMIISDTCNICLGDMNEYVFIQCGHAFHKDCIGEWLIDKKTCPCCRKSVKSKMDTDEINNYLDQISFNINEYGNILITRDFVEWIFEMSRIYISDVTSISLYDILYVVQLPNNFEYYFRVYSNEINNISINLFELELKLNQIANNIRSWNEYNNLDENEEESENEYENEMININELEFTEF